MKKRVFSILAVCMSAAILSACSMDTSTSFSANWYSNPASATSVLPETNETLVYSVSLDTETKTNTSYSAEYSDGVYTTNLTDENGLYRYTTKLEIKVQFVLGEEKSEVFTDTVETEAYFKGTGSGLQPVSSKKTVESHSPFSLSPATLESCYRHYKYVATTTYNEEGTKGTYTYDDLLSETEEVEVNEKSFSIPSSYSYLDNEQLLFAVRGINSSTAQSISVYNGAFKKVQTVSVSRSAEKSGTFKFALEGEEAATERTVDYYPYSVVISSTNNSGGTRELMIANSKYRSAILEIKDPLSFSLGTLVYTLQKANFS